MQIVLSAAPNVGEVMSLNKHYKHRYTYWIIATVFLTCGSVLLLSAIFRPTVYAPLHVVVATGWLFLGGRELSRYYKS